MRVVCCLCSGLMCKVSAGNDVACLTTNHLAALARLEPRLVPLVLAFRYWANVWLTLTLSRNYSSRFSPRSKKMVFFFVCFFLAVPHRLPGGGRNPILLAVSHGHILPATESEAHPARLSWTLGESWCFRKSRTK